MGTRMFDQYTLLHFAAGVVAYFWNVSLFLWFVAHALFEGLENTPAGIRLINSLWYWPGGKSKADAPANIVGDNIGALLGWLAAYHLDQLGAYPAHIKQKIK